MLSPFRRLLSRPAQPARRLRRTPLCLEVLEDRCVPAATLNLSMAGLLQFAGTTTGDVLGVSYDVSKAQYTFRDITEPIDFNNNSIPTEYVYIPKAGVNAIEIDGGDAPNVFYIDSIANKLTVNGGSSSDTLVIGNDLNGIGASIDFHGGAGTNTISVSDYAGPDVGHEYTLTASAIRRANATIATYDSHTQWVWLNPGIGDNVIHVQGTSASAQTQITMQPTGTDAIWVGSSADTLDSIQGVLVVVGADGSLGRNDDLYLDDLGSAANNTYEVATWGDPAGGAMTLSRNGQLLVSAGYLRKYELDTGSGADTVNVTGTGTGTTTTVQLGAGNDDVEVGDPFHGLDYLYGPLVLHGGAAHYGDKLHINDANAAANHIYDLSASDFDRASPSGGSIQPISFSGFYNIQIDLTSFDDFLDVTGAPPTSNVTVNMGAGNDTILSTTANHHYYLTGLNQGYWKMGGQVVNFTSVENIDGWTGTTTVHFLPGGGVSGNVIDSVDGDATLDYSALPQGVRVNLELRTATAVGGIVSGFENVTGGQGPNLLVGDDNPNKLTGGPNGNVLVGGGGADTLQGGPGSDLIIGGTAFNYDQTSLDAVFLEWINPADTFIMKVLHLFLGGGLNGNVKVIPGKTVVSDGLMNAIKPGGGDDWIIP